MDTNKGRKYKQRLTVNPLKKKMKEKIIGEAENIGA